MKIIVVFLIGFAIGGLLFYQPHDPEKVYTYKDMEQVALDTLQVWRMISGTPIDSVCTKEGLKAWQKLHGENQVPAIYCLNQELLTPQ